MKAAGAPLHPRPQQEAGFSVLKSPDIPSALLELGFLSNGEDAENLANPAWRAQVAESLAEALIAVTVRLAARGNADFNEHRWVLLSPWGRVGLGLGAAAVVAILALAWRSTQGVTAWRRAIILGLRASAAMTALFLFLEPAIELRQVAREPNRIAVMIDDSASMNLAETKAGPRRIDRARQLLAASEPALAAWSRDHRLDFFSFSDAVLALPSKESIPSEATGKSTLLRKALEHVRGRYDGRDLAGIIVISDGAATGGFDEDAEDFLRGLETRVHTVWAARPGLRDLAVKSVLADEFAFVRTVVRIDAVIQSTGLSAQKIPVTLSTDGQPLRQKVVELPAGDHEVRVTFEITPPRVGRYVYEVAVPHVGGESVTSNNARAFVVRVLRDKIRVLQVAGQPSWDVRALRQMLKANPNVDLISFFILRTQDDISLVPNDEMSLIPFPTRELFEEQLPSFDLIVLQNFEYLPYGIGDYLESIRAYVEGGGALAMLGGAQSFASSGAGGGGGGRLDPLGCRRARQDGEALHRRELRLHLQRARGHPGAVRLEHVEDDERTAALDVHALQAGEDLLVVELLEALLVRHQLGLELLLAQLRRALLAVHVGLRIEHPRQERDAAQIARAPRHQHGVAPAPHGKQAPEPHREVGTHRDEPVLGVAQIHRHQLFWPGVGAHRAGLVRDEDEPLLVAVAKWHAGKQLHLGARI
ncbi:MAG TPA: N-acetylmuramoyl-L-alanine amidase [Kofleriaceae bacterium]|nr:N-acetylmuramoyl-L-alanine amidase [Kofleriaceae bacterium]